MFDLTALSAKDKADLQRETAPFTSRKLDWINALNFEPNRHPVDIKVALVIASHLNQVTGTAYVSTETIACEAGHIGERNVKYARKRLRRDGWLTWKRTRSANVYQPLFGKVDDALAARKAEADKRRDRYREKVALTLSSSPSLSSEGVPSRVFEGNLLHSEKCNALHVWSDEECPF